MQLDFNIGDKFYFQDGPYTYEDHIKKIVIDRDGALYEGFEVEFEQEDLGEKIFKSKKEADGITWYIDKEINNEK